MPETPRAYVLDSFALLAYFQAEPGGAYVRDLIRAASSRTASLYVSVINIGEMYYIVSRRRSAQRAEALISDLRHLPITFCAATEERILSAARIKAEHPISYADAFAASLAQELQASLVTGDPEFEAVKQIIAVLWLPEP
jgi:ribonuclease VapC